LKAKNVCMNFRMGFSYTPVKIELNLYFQGLYPITRPHTSLLNSFSSVRASKDTKTGRPWGQCMGFSQVNNCSTSAVIPFKYKFFILLTYIKPLHSYILCL
jgi:hypothetical protein